jgi:hypothetical protein
MTVTVNDLVLAVRRQTGDWGAALMTLDTGMDATATTVSVVARPDVVDTNQFLEINTEEMEITDISEDITVLRAAKGTAAQVHASGDMVLVKPRFSNLTILNALIRAERVLAGHIPCRTVSTTTTIASGTEEYSMPSGTEYVERVRIETSTAGLYRPFHMFMVLENYDPPKIYIPLGKAAVGKTLELTTLGQYSEFQWGATVSDIPAKYHNFLTEYACGVLIEDEDSSITSQTEQAHGIVPKPGVNQQVGRNMQAAAFAHLEAVRPMTRIVYRSDQRVIRN